MNAQALKSIVKLCDTDSNANTIQKVRICTIMYSQQMLLHTYYVPGNCSQHWTTAVNKNTHKYSHEANILVEGDKK